MVWTLGPRAARPRSKRHSRRHVRRTGFFERRHAASVPRVSSLYDQIGRGYAATRQPDARIGRRIVAALDGCESVVNIGAGSGSYEPEDRSVVAVEPSGRMISRRRPGAAPVLRGVAGDLPFRAGAFDASLAILTLHHWPDWRRGVAEMARVARRTVAILTWETQAGSSFWLLDYLPEILAMDLPRFPTMAEIGAATGRRFEVEPVPVPRDCQDGFLGAWWARPESYLDAEVHRGISTFQQVDPAAVARGLDRLDGDLRSGRWDERYGGLRTPAETDLGYRLVVARRA